MKAAAQVGQRPVIVDGTQVHGGVGVGHAQVLTVVGEGVAAVAVVNHGEDLGLAVAGQNAVSQSHIHTGVVVAGLDGGQSLAVGGGVDDHPVTVGDGAGGDGGLGDHRLRDNGLGHDRLAGLHSSTVIELEQSDGLLIGVGGGLVSRP